MSATTQSGNNFDQLHVGDLVYLNNYYSPTPSDVNVSWTVACGTQLGFNCYELPVEGSLEDTGECMVCFNVQEGGTSTSYVRAYPAILFGSLYGRDSSWGVGAKVGCDLTPVLAPSGRCWGSAVYDMNVVNANTSLPEIASSLPSVMELCFDERYCSGPTNAIASNFLDSYFHYIGDPALWPDNYDPAWGDLNKINARKTATWNLNVWFCEPPDPPGQTPLTASQWTGGNYLRSLNIGGKQFDIYCKHEFAPVQFDDGCSAGFFYIGFFCNPDQCGQPVCLDYRALYDYISSQQFKNDVLSSPDCLQIYQNLGSPPFIVDEPNNFVLDGILIGKELWFSPTDAVTCSCFSDLTLTLGDATYGKTNREITSLAECLATVEVQNNGNWCDGPIRPIICLKDSSGQPWNYDSSALSALNFQTAYASGIVDYSTFQFEPDMNSRCFSFEWTADANAQAGDVIQITITPNATECDPVIGSFQLGSCDNGSFDCQKVLFL